MTMGYLQALQTLRCPKCGHTWTPRVEKPQECPHCKTRLSKQPK